MTAVARFRHWKAEDGSRGVRLFLWCPGCDDLHAPEVGDPAKHWEWDGNLDAPTISPSLLVNGVQWDTDSSFHKPRHTVASGEKTTCHSFVRQGRWEFLSDCTHSLAGTTVALVPLPDWFVRDEEALPDTTEPTRAE